MRTPVLIGASIPPGLEGVKNFKKLKLGDCVLTMLPMEKAEALAVASFCRENGIRLYFSELLYRGSTDLCWAARRKMKREEFFSRKELEEIFDAAGEFYGGRMTLGEAGGILYWPKAYLINRRVDEFVNLPSVQTVDEAKKAYIRYLRQFIDYELNEIGRGPLIDVDSSLVFKYHAMAGLDVLCHEMMPGDPHRMQAAVRGAARAFGKSWGTHIAMQCYGGMSFDTLWLKRWKTSLYYSYITGAEFIWPESGHYQYDAYYGVDALARYGKSCGFHSKETKSVRRILRETYQFSRTHTRPESGPRTPLGVVYGQYDGTPGLWNPYAWGQYGGRKWLAGAPEKGWELLDLFHRKEEWSSAYVQGETDFSGNPPCGQYDIVPVEADIEVLKRYSCLLFLGWNTMTEDIYGKLKEYVRAGGHLIMYLAHLSTHTDRAQDLQLFRGGDFSDLFGVKILGKGETDVRGIKCMAPSSLPAYRFPLWGINTDPRFMGHFTPARVEVSTGKVISGHDDYYQVTPEVLAARPVLVENTLGRGKTFLVTVWEYPADDAMLPFTKDLLRTVLSGEQDEIRLFSSDRVRYAVYDGRAPGSNRKYSVIYLLNTDPDCSATARLWVRGKTTSPFEIPANEMRIAYLLGRILILPDDRKVDLKKWMAGGSRKQEVEFYSLTNQRVAVYGLDTQPVTLRLGSAKVVVKPGGCVMARIRRMVNPSCVEFYAPDFLEEPAIRHSDTKTPY